MEATTTRLLITVSLVTCAADANSVLKARRSPMPQLNTTCPGLRPNQPAHQVRLPCETHCGGLHSVIDAKSVQRPRRAAAAVSATIKATGSPTWRAAPSARARCGGFAISEPSRVLQRRSAGNLLRPIGLQIRGGIDRPHPGHRSRRCGMMGSMLAAACGLLRTTMSVQHARQRDIIRVAADALQ